VALRATLLACGLPCSPRALRDFRAINEALWERYRRKELGQAELAVERFRQLALTLPGRKAPAARLAKTFVEQLSLRGDLVPGCRALLRELAPSYRLAIVTNGIDRVQRARLRVSRLEDFFAAIVTSEGSGFAKPDPRILGVALEALGVTAREAVYVGDDVRVDGVAARAAGMRFVWMRRFAELPPGARLPRHRITSLAELPAVL
jgi:2-haloacid dehalogenase